MNLSTESILALVTLLTTCAPLSFFVYRVYQGWRQARELTFSTCISALHAFHHTDLMVKIMI